MTDDERFPLMTEVGWRRLKWLQECEFAPRYSGPCGHRLTDDYLRQVRAFERDVQAGPTGWGPGVYPNWLTDFVDFCCRDVPFYRRYGARPADFTSIPPLDRSDLAPEPWAFVPDSQPLTDLLLYSTSGTTGHPLEVISHPTAAASYAVLYRAALAHYGLTLEGGDRISSLLVCFQQRTLTYACVIPLLDFAGTAKINLNPTAPDWRDPSDVVKFIEACDPEIFTGDPLSFAELARLPIQVHPKALISTAMMLAPGLRQALEQRFGCPVLDIHSMNETGPIALKLDDGARLLQPRLYVEILDPDGLPCPPGVRGEMTITGGFNPFLPLLRYHTNDYAALEFRGNQPILVGLEGRSPVTFRTLSGGFVNNVDVTMTLRPFALPQFAFHQFADGAVRLRVRNATVSHTELRAALEAVFGVGHPITIEDVATLGASGDKVVQYTSET